MTYRLTVFLVLLFNITFSQNPLPLIPQPESIEIRKGHFVLNKETVIQADENSFEAQYLQQAIKQQTGLLLAIVAKSNVDSKIILKEMYPIDPYWSKERYNINISPTEVIITAPFNHGFFTGIQTLLQLVPIDKNETFVLPCLNIFDQPKYAWRGMHLDCARHFFSLDFVKKYIDYLAMYKFNTFHWHLTDDQGWRIEIKQYPKLTEVGAWRNGSMIGHYNEQKYDDKRYGGFYTQDQIKEVVAYAKQRHITVVPEIEMPGHAVAALAAYPQYSCTGGPFEVGKQWGVLDDVFCPKDETFTFLENILSEVMALFPSQYIHIGGDECPKTRWKNCPHCQNLMKEKGLKDEHELQSYFIQRIEKFVNAKGRKIIGWDEILEGGLAPNAAVMSWRGTEGGIAAAKQKHFVVMTPGSHCYFDHYQGDPKNEPLAIGGYTPVEKVYAFNPIPNELSNEESKYILGAQANVWTEYIDTPEQVEYMIFPRMLALSEVLWGTSNPQKYADFQNRMIQQFPTLDKKGINYSKAIFEITTKVNPSTDGILFELNSANDAKKIKYTTDGTDPTISSNAYANPIAITKSQTIKAAYFESGKQQSATIEQAFNLNKATGKKVTLVNLPHENYSNGGAFTLVNGISASRGKLGKDWLGFSGKDMNATIDLGKSEPINKVSISVLESQGSWIYYPKEIAILVSNDGQNFQSIHQLSLAEIKEVKGTVAVNFKSQNAQYIKVIATNLGKISEGNPGAGSDAWLFVDEIGIE
ncbi:family 20 glycosylhydrolase [Flavobacterium buctense]|uniref:beta-N-acetylhexosaminidase n=1 Tax=Flavobacterium buctense TaxID=1648146 RepID=A0ABU9E0L1_9FLAO|nr:family 20 glycosylhydrolase [Flavobacterium buctense]